MLWLFLININAVAGDTVTCEFTIDNYISNIWLDGVDVSSTAGNIDDWTSKKTLTFDDTSNVLAIKGNDAESGCSSGGLALRCTSTNPDSVWNMNSADARTDWLVASASGSFATPSTDAEGRAWYEPGYIVPPDEFGEPLLSTVQWLWDDSGSVVKMCGTESGEPYWHFLFAHTPRVEYYEPFVFPNDEAQRAICRTKTTAYECEDDNQCSWNVFQAMCNEHGYQPLFWGCHECRITTTTTTTTTAPKVCTDNPSNPVYCTNYGSSYRPPGIPSYQACKEYCEDDPTCNDGYWFINGNECHLFGPAGSNDQNCNPAQLANNAMFTCSQ